MPKGLLELSGTIDLTQFWPAGESDADTAKVVVTGADAFRFRPHPGAAMKVTHAFNGAKVVGKGSKACIDTKGQVTIRLQAIDAPELHYRPTIPTINKKKPTAAQKTKFKDNNGNFRQKLGESAAMALEKFLSGFGAGPLQCVIRTQVDEPSDVFDMFGRMIGDVIIPHNGKEQDANRWLCEQGWAYPTFYSSMTAEEITDFQQLAAAARKNKRGIWKSNSTDLTKFDKTLVFRKNGKVQADTGPVFMPKLFRRSSTYAVAKAAGMTSAKFKGYLEMEPDPCFTTKAFLEDGPTVATHQQLADFVSPAGKFLVSAGDLVFQEGKSKVVGANGKPAAW